MKRLTIISVLFYLFNPSTHASTGEALYIQKCAVCHSAGNAAFLKLMHKYGPEQADLVVREIPQALVTTAVRYGLGSMPALTKGDVTNAELIEIANYLAAEERKEAK